MAHLMTAVEPNTVRKSRELSRLITAAVISTQFCELLLRDPGQALAKGHSGETFCLSVEEQAWVLSIQARSLPEFAAQLVAYQYGDGNLALEQPAAPMRRRGGEARRDSSRRADAIENVHDDVGDKIQPQRSAA
jgi:hypothetical protein